MSTIIAPRYELPLLGTDGRISREWYKFLVQIANSIDRSGTSFDDLVTLQNTETFESVVLNLQNTLANTSPLLFESLDKPQPTDSTLLALWPGESK